MVFKVKSIVCIQFIKKLLNHSFCILFKLELEQDISNVKICWKYDNFWQQQYDVHCSVTKVLHVRQLCARVQRCFQNSGFSFRLWIRQATFNNSWSTIMKLTSFADKNRQLQPYARCNHLDNVKQIVCYIIEETVKLTVQLVLCAPCMVAWLRFDFQNTVKPSIVFVDWRSLPSFRWAVLQTLPK